MNNTLKEFILSDLQRLNYNKNQSDASFLLKIIKYCLINPSFRAIFVYRIMNYRYLKNKKTPKITLLFSLLINKINIPYTSIIGKGLLIPHAECIILNRNCEIGENVTILQGVTLGGNIFKEKNGQTSPKIGSNVLISAGAKILGPVSVGKNSIIGANAVVINDIPENSVAVGVPAKVVKKVEKSFINLQIENSE